MSSKDLLFFVTDVDFARKMPLS